MSEPVSMLDAALGLAAREFRVLPVWWPVNGGCSCGIEACDSPGKHPIEELVEHGVSEASSEPVLIRRWIEKFPEMNIGVRVGERFVVVDFDSPEALSRFEMEIPEPLPPTLMEQSGRGVHIWLELPEGAEVKSGTNVLGKGIDIKTGNSYVVAPPSLHASGRRYFHLSAPEATIAPCPAWLLERLQMRKADGQERGQGINPVELLKGVPKGERDDKLWKYACSLRARGFCSKAEARDLVLVAAARCTTADGARPEPFDPTIAAEKVERAWTRPENEVRAELAQTGPTGAAGTEAEAPVDTVREAVPDGWLRPADVLRHSPLPKARFRSTLAALNRATKDRGYPTGSVIVYQGPPDSGKTALVIQECVRIATTSEAVVVLYTPDQGRESTAIRVGALLGLDAGKLEDREEAEVAKLESLLYERRLFLPDDSAEDGYVRNIIAQATKIRPDLPHVLGLDSLQEARANEKADDASEKDRTLANVRLCRAAASSPIQWLVLAASQVTKASTARDPKNRPLDVFAGSDTGKIAFLTQMIVGLSGDPAVGPDYGRGRAVKSKLGPKLSAFGLKLNLETTALEEIDAPAAEEEREERRQKTRMKASDGAQKKLQAAMRKHLPEEIVSGRPGLSENRLARKAGMSRTKEAFQDGLSALEAQGVFQEVAGPRGGHYWRWKDGNIPGDA